MKERGFIGIIGLVIGIAIIALMAFGLLKRELVPTNSTEPQIEERVISGNTSIESGRSAIKRAEEAKRLLEQR